MITHVVIFWADKPHGENKEKLLAGASTLAEIPGVLEFRFGPAVPSSRAVVDDSFAVAISMTFRSPADLDAYIAHPIHAQFVEECVRPLSRRFVVYDFGGESR
jgi:hypothetical protein